MSNNVRWHAEHDDAQSSFVRSGLTPSKRLADEKGGRQIGPKPVRTARTLRRRDWQVLTVISDYLRHEGRAPSLREICDVLNLRCIEQASRTICRLIRAGKVSRTGPPLKRSRAPSLQLVRSGEFGWAQ